MRTQILTIAFSIASLVAFGQWTIDNSKSEMTIFGTSNVHDWEEVVETIKGDMVATMNGSSLSDISTLKITIPVKSIKSGHGAMNKNTYNALNADDYPNIQFVLKSVRIDGRTIYCTGTLNIAGTTKTITTPVTYSIQSGVVTVKGSYSMNMTDFNVEPPTAMFGTIYTGEEIKLDFTLALSK
jgi:polyisoprenoid-binding protein YceI